ncbi:putative transporter [Xylariaceae sp. FL0804]|nr:putative transporter [Xylariaceae sp. FL0804]
MGLLSIFDRFSLTREVTPKLFLVYMFMSIGAINFGFDNGWWASVIALQQFADSFGPVDPATGEHYLPSGWQSAGSGTGNAGMAIGCIIASPLIRRIGRKRTVLVICVLALVGMTMQNAIPSFWGIMMGRMVNAVSMGLEANNIPIFMSELSPPAVRGSLINFYQWWQIVGVILARCVVIRSNAMWPDSEWAWRLVMVIQMIVPVLLIGIFWMVPESPNWLLSRGRRAEAHASLAYIRQGAAGEAEVEQELRLIEQAVREQREHHRATTYWDCLRGTNGRRTLVAASCQVLQQLQGNAFMSSYSVLFLQQVGLTNPFVSSLATVSLALAGATMGFWLPDAVGRRPIMMAASFVMWAGLWITSGMAAWWPGGIHGGAPSGGLLALLMIWNMVSTGGWGSCVWITTAESGTAQLREKTVSIATTVSFVCVLLVSYINPFVQNAPGNLGARVGFVYGSFSLIAIPWVFFMVPELKGRSLEELDELFNEKVAARRFKSYVAHGVGARITEVQNANADTKHASKGVEDADMEGSEAGAHDGKNVSKATVSQQGV